MTGGSPQQEVADPTEELRGELPPREAGGEEREEPRESSVPHLSIGQDARAVSAPVGRCLFPFRLVFPLGRKPGSAAIGLHTHASRGLGLEPRVPLEPRTAGTRVNSGGTLRQPVAEYWIRSAVSVQFSPMTKEETYTDGDGKLQMRGVLLEGPYLRVYPDGQPSGFFWLGGRDSKEAEIVLPIRPGVLRGTEDITPRVFANMFHAQEIPLGPFHLDVDPTHV